MKRLMKKTWPTWMLYAFVTGFCDSWDDYCDGAPFIGPGWESANRVYARGAQLRLRLERMKI